MRAAAHTAVQSPASWGLPVPGAPLHRHEIAAQSRKQSSLRTPSTAAGAARRSGARVAMAVVTGLGTVVARGRGVYSTDRRVIVVGLTRSRPVKPGPRPTPLGLASRGCSGSRPSQVPSTRGRSPHPSIGAVGVVSRHGRGTGAPYWALVASPAPEEPEVRRSSGGRSMLKIPIQLLWSQP